VGEGTRQDFNVFGCHLCPGWPFWVILGVFSCSVDGATAHMGPETCAMQAEPQLISTKIPLVGGTAVVLTVY
jgi:hypothetical protein